MSSEALGAMRRRHAAPTSGPWDTALRGSISGYMEQARLDVLALLAEVARLEQERDEAKHQRDNFERIAREQAEWRAALVDEPAADPETDSGDDRDAVVSSSEIRASVHPGVAWVTTPDPASAAADEPGETP